MKFYLILGAFLVDICVTFAQKDKNTTPVPILKQINKHNEDGSYSYGYESADGTFKIETKYPNGEVYGKYGYVDDTGKLREIEYGASKRGFEPNGNDIQVPPPTLKQNVGTTRTSSQLDNNDIEDDGQYREDPRIYEGRNYNNNRQNYQNQAKYEAVPQFSGFDFNWDHGSRFQPQAAPQTYQRPEPVFRPQTYYNPAPQTYQPPQPAFRQNYYNPQPSYYNNNNWNQFQGHPASNVDIWTGSYSVNYRR